MRKKIGISLLLLLSACTQKEFATMEEVALANEHLKKPAPEYIVYTVKGLKSVECEEGNCNMSEQDFRQNQHDKKSLLELHKLDHARYSSLTENYNLQIDRVTINQMATVEMEKALHYKKQELKRSEMGNSIQKWAERVLTVILCVTVAC